VTSPNGLATTKLKHREPRPSLVWSVYTNTCVYVDGWVGGVGVGVGVGVGAGCESGCGCVWRGGGWVDEWMG